MLMNREINVFFDCAKKVMVYQFFVYYNAYLEGRNEG